MIELRAIDRHFQVGDQLVRALDGVTLTIADGEYVSIMGPSGSGKSTLLNVIGLLDRPTAGQYVLDGRETTDLDDDALADVRARRIGFIFQSFHLVPRLTAFENVELPMVLAGHAPAARRARAEESQRQSQSRESDARDQGSSSASNLPTRRACGCWPRLPTRSGAAVPMAQTWKR